MKTHSLFSLSFNFFKYFNLFKYFKFFNKELKLLKGVKEEWVEAAPAFSSPRAYARARRRP